MLNVIKGIVAFARFGKVVSKIPVKCAYYVKLFLNIYAFGQQ